MLESPFTISYAIQLAVAPVFLLTGIAALLGVLTGRHARIIDRARLFQQGGITTLELANLARRGRLMHWAVGLCAFSAILIASVIAIIFIGFMMAVKTADYVAILFILATFIFIIAMLLFLWEIHLATYSAIFSTDRLPHARIAEGERNARMEH